MRKLVIAVLITCLAIPILASQSQASSTPVEMATMEEALIVAENWVELIIKSKGSWGGSETAEVDEIQEFKRGDRVIGYFCRVEPQGFIITSLYKELSPIKAYSATSDLDPECEEGMADVIKAGMDRVLAALELQLGPIESASSEDIQDILEINYLQAWEELQGDLTELKRDLGSGVSKGNYQEGEVLLSSNWNQRPPYNDQCPDMGCYWDDRYLDSSGVTSTNWLSSPFYNENALVGCIAIAGAQTMRHWAWPPYRGNPDDRYDWPNILNEYEWDSWVGTFVDDNGNPVTQIQVNAVAELCHEVGVEAGMEYDCESSVACFASCIGKDLLDTFEDHFRYSTAADDYSRDDWSAVGWFNQIKGQLNLNRPLPYDSEGHHAWVCDGWQEIGSAPLRQYHMNYGWSGLHCRHCCDPGQPPWPGNSNTWYTLDELPCWPTDSEQMLVNIYPAQALMSSLSGTYSQQSFPYRYFDQDATGGSATFKPGQFLQFLPGIEVTCTSTAGGSIQFQGSSTENTLLFTRGDESEGVRIYNGVIKLNKDGSITFP